MLLDLIAGTRPNFVKIAPIAAAIRSLQDNGYPVSFRLVHTGQHYDDNMSGNFFRQLGIPEPDINLGAGGATQAQQTASIMVAYEQVLLQKKPDLVLTVGDVTSAMACTIAARKIEGIKIAHVEAGLRSYDWTMPEEINRILADSVSDYLFTTTREAGANLLKAGVPEERIFFVGNTMIDSLLQHKPHFRQPEWWTQLELEEQQYFVLTLHRPGNVDNAATLGRLIDAVTAAAAGMPIIFPVHPRTHKVLTDMHWKGAKNLHVTEPMGYLEFNYLVLHAKAVITDSGGVSEEATVLNVPCLSLRNNTERPETCTIGTNELAGTDPEMIGRLMAGLLSGGWKQGRVPELWDGRAAVRIAAELMKLFGIHE